MSVHVRILSNFKFFCFLKCSFSFSKAQPYTLSLPGDMSCATYLYLHSYLLTCLGWMIQPWEMTPEVLRGMITGVSFGYSWSLKLTPKAWAQEDSKRHFFHSTFFILFSLFLFIIFPWWLFLSLFLFFLYYTTLHMDSHQILNTKN